MRTHKSRVRIVLAVLLAGVVVLNSGFLYVAFGLSGDSRPERLDELRIKIERGEIEVTKERFLSSLSNMKRYAVASDTLVDVFQKAIALLAVTNIVVVLTVVVWLWRTIERRKPNEEVHR